ncbi:hypothetical protein CC80DRAFT_534516 [Byssothecium circinans]|uniref:DUF6590 domain-containing protein n=1 Tax=Byssothecium circinans TaxID=147558 RepID=A0A6A5TZK4_9PLEO|nr:hypothetical protein CC80DRAFT_534516 [Byssothecium circinans]
MSASGVNWTWSDTYKDYYYVTQDQAGNHHYHWQKDEAVATQQASVPQSQYAYQQASYAPSNSATYPSSQNARRTSQSAYSPSQNAYSASQLTHPSSQPAYPPSQPTYQVARTSHPHQSTYQPLHSSHASQSAYLAPQVPRTRVDSGTYSHDQVQNSLGAQLATSPGRTSAPYHGHTQGGAPQAAQLVAEMPAPLSPNERSRIPGLIPGTPNDGWYDSLDSSYRMRTGQEAREFFRIGRVFSMLYTEAASGQTSANAAADNDAFTVVRFDGLAHTQIRRFVIVKVMRGFVYACAIFTYGNRGTLKPGCVPSEHTIVYFSGTNPASCYIQGEYEAGMTKEPIEIIPSEGGIFMKRESRLRFSKIYPIEWNVKVKDIGRVKPEQKSHLLACWDAEFRT